MTSFYYSESILNLKTMCFKYSWHIIIELHNQNITFSNMRHTMIKQTQGRHSHFMKKCNRCDVFHEEIGYMDIPFLISKHLMENDMIHGVKYRKNTIGRSILFSYCCLCLQINTYTYFDNISWFQFIFTAHIVVYFNQVHQNSTDTGQIMY